MKKLSITVGALAVALTALLTPATVRADPGDKAGWSVSIDPRKRAFLHYSEVDGGPRIVMVGCLTDVDSFFLSVDGLVGLRIHQVDVRVSLSADGAGFLTRGLIANDPVTGRRVVTAERTADAAARRKIAAELLPVLRAQGPIALTVADVRPFNLPLAASPGIAGIAGPLDAFAKVCFGAR